MIIDKKLNKYIILAEDTILQALQKISGNKNRIIFSVTEHGLLEGVLTDGDFRRWIITQNEIDLQQPVSAISNKDYAFAFENDPPDKIQSFLSRKIQFVPIVDHNHHLIAIARPHDGTLKLGDYSIGSGHPVFVIAEIGINHNGHLDIAKKLIDYAVAAGANCAKFQMRDLSSLYANEGNANDAHENLGAQYTLDLLTRFQLTTEEMFAAFDYCQTQGILPLCTPWDLKSLALLESYGMLAYKVASPDLTNHDMLRVLGKTGKPLICSTGMSTEQEIIETVNLLRSQGTMYMLLHCNSTYPAPFKDVNLNYLDRLQKLGNCPIGYSGHERGSNIAIAAVAKGAKVIEKHLTLDRSMEGNDHKVSLLPEEFRTMVEGIRQTEQALGSLAERKLSQGEMMNRTTLAKSLIINRDLKLGQIITADMIEVKSPGRGLQPNRKVELLGKRAKRDFEAGDIFFPTDLAKNKVQARQYSFKRLWGIPVRYHDFKTILTKSNPDFLEFHLSYKDLEENISYYFDQVYDLDFTVHSPDVFSGDHLMSLSHPDKVHRQHSIQALQRVIDLTRNLKPFFKKSTKPLIIVSLGGFTRDSLLLPSERPERYKQLAKSLEQLDTEGVEIIPQTLPPFPWYFGGQLYLNLFVDPKDTAKFCQENGYRVCLDISHAKLACNHFKWSFKELVEQVGPYATHLHIADAKGVDGEGIQISEGDIDFPALADSLEKVAPQASFIPEIWQGHENEGEGFWIGLERLEQWF